MQDLKLHLLHLFI